MASVIGTPVIVDDGARMQRRRVDIASEGVVQIRTGDRTLISLSLTGA